VANRQNKATPTPKRERLTLAPRLLLKTWSVSANGAFNKRCNENGCVMPPEGQNK